MFILVSRIFYQNIKEVEIQKSYRSDHSPIVLHFTITDFNIRKGLWKFYDSLLYDIQYLKTVKEKIKQV